MALFIRVYGRVQGVGFRPYVFRLAKKLGLKGWVLNSSRGVEILLEGNPENLALFEKNLADDPPPLAKIERIEKNITEDSGLTEFKIRESKKEEGYIFISPDIATCDDCLRELFDPYDRRYRYPFINCTNCGPRYSIIEDIPYDREKTTMKSFEMCELCLSEYTDAGSRRFHAQPDACSVCGPRLWIEGREVEDVFSELRKILFEEEKIIAIKGVGGFHIALDATNSRLVERLRTSKNRPNKPFAIMVRDVDVAKKYCNVSDEEEEILKSKERPIVLLKINDLGDISPLIAPNNKYLGIMLPYNPIQYLLFEGVDRPLVMTSGNLGEEPIVGDNNRAKEILKELVDVFVLHDRDIKNRLDDSVVFLPDKSPQFIRRSRGYAPDPIVMNWRVRPALALGGELKNTFCLANGRNAFLSSHIGDLKNMETYDFFEETVQTYLSLFRTEPEIVIHDMHPQYVTTELASRLQNSFEVKSIQHHKAHIQSLLIDRAVSEEIIGVSFDGTGFGEDGRIWGGEFFFGGLKGLKRVGHFEYFPLIGGDYSIENPLRTLYSLSLGFFDGSVGDFKKISDIEKETMKRMKEMDFNTFYTSSAGRIFDAFSSLLGVRDKVDFEGQAAIDLEMLSTGEKTEKTFNFNIKAGEPAIIVFGDIFIEAFERFKKGDNIPHLGMMFHNTMVKIILDVSEMLRNIYGTNKIGISGGVFQNRIILEKLKEKSLDRGFILINHQRVPTNDGGISLGQISMALEEV
jgi:hydrogenase maturation protein HypF